MQTSIKMFPLGQSIKGFESSKQANEWQSLGIGKNVDAKVSNGEAEKHRGCPISSLHSSGKQVLETLPYINYEDRKISAII